MVATSHKRRSPALLVGGIAATVFAIAVAVQYYYLSITHLNPATVSASEFHRELADAGMEYEATGGFRVLPWSGRARTDDDVRSLISSLDLGAASIASGPHVNLVSIQSSLRLQRPVLNTIAAWSNETTSLWVLRQRVMIQNGYWRTYGIAQDRTRSPNVATFFELRSGRPVFTGDSGGVSCFTCHASGPRALRPLRSDLVESTQTMDTLNAAVADNGFVALRVPASETMPDLGPALSAPSCVECHSQGGERAPLYRVHAASIRALIASGAMPREGALTSEGMKAIEAWLGGR